MRDLDEVPRAVKNETFYLIARLCSILIMTVFIPIAGVMLNRAMAKADEISAQMQAQNISLQILTATVTSQFSRDEKSLTDHELRIRQIERK